MNSVILIGNLTRDPELKYLPTNQTAVSNYSIAVTNPYRKGDDGKPTADFFNIITFGKQAETLVRYMKKGCKLAVEGRLQSRKWEDQNGQRRTVVEVVTNRIEFLSYPDSDKEQTYNSNVTHDDSSDDDLPF